MSENEFDYGIVNPDSKTVENAELIEKIENAYRIYKLSELSLKDAEDDYGTLKIAKLRLEFARHELAVLLKEAQNKGIRWKDDETIKRLLHPDP